MEISEPSPEHLPEHLPDQSPDHLLNSKKSFLSTSAILIVLTIALPLLQFFVVGHSDYDILIKPNGKPVITLETIRPYLPFLSSAVSLCIGLVTLLSAFLVARAKRLESAWISGSIFFLLWNIAFAVGFYWLVLMSLGENYISSIEVSTFVRLFVTALLQIVSAAAVFAGVLALGAGPMIFGWQRAPEMKMVHEAGE